MEVKGMGKGGERGERVCSRDRCRSVIRLYYLSFKQN